ncbi:hypothetical protein LXA43DRAFT_1101440 [Ganoderma leucocontextum]|nr:hypothetical protein LXA43DRAFT_1101440 [Ganoderma leucocontextum]
MSVAQELSFLYPYIYCNYAACVILVYDWFLCLGQEVRFIWNWHSKVTSSLLVYAFSRYAMLAQLLLVVATNYPMSDLVCSTARILLDNTNGPTIALSSDNVVWRGSQLAAELLVVGITWWYSYQSYRIQKGIKIGKTISSLLIYNGSLYFLFLATLYILAIIFGTTSNLLDGGSDVLDFIGVFYDPLTSILTCRFILSLRQFDTSPASLACSETGSRVREHTASRDILQFAAQPSDSLPAFIASFAGPVHLDYALSETDPDAIDNSGAEWQEMDVVAPTRTTASSQSPGREQPPELEHSCQALLDHTVLLFPPRQHLAPSVFILRRHVGVHREHVSDVSNTEFPGHYPDQDHRWSLENFKENLRVSVSQRSVDVGLVGVDASIPNTFRGILIAEVPKIAIEAVYVFNNTSVIHCKVLYHRLDLIPLNVDPRLFEFRSQGGTLLYPKRIIEIEGLRKEHAKWSAVETASHRLHPLVVLNPSKPVPRENAEKFARCFSPGIIKTMSREALRHKEFDGCVELRLIRDWLIFSVESEGPYTPESLLPEVIKVMRGKIASIHAAAEALLADSEDLGSGAVVGGPYADGDVEMNGE